MQARPKPTIRALALLAGVFLGMIAQPMAAHATTSWTTNFTYRGLPLGVLATDAAQAPDGRIVVTGFTNGVEKEDIALARYKAGSSQLDPTFDKDGRQVTPASAVSPYPYIRSNDVAVQADGRIVVVGKAYGPSGTPEASLLVRYKTDGSLDPSFDGDGIRTISLSLTGPEGFVAVAVQSDGKIVTAGYAYPSNWMVSRFNPDGSLDPSFDGNGIAIANFDTGPLDIAVQGDGKILVAGSTRVTRFTSDGALDLQTTFSFGEGLFPYSNYYSLTASLISVAPASGGRIVVAGSCNNAIGDKSCVGVVRLNPDGSADTTFSGDGRLTWDKPSWQEEIGAVAVATNGQITVMGSSAPVADQESWYRFFALRFSGTGTLVSQKSLEVQHAATGSAVASGGVVEKDGRAVVAGHKSSSIKPGGFTFVRFDP